MLLPGASDEVELDPDQLDRLTGAGMRLRGEVGFVVNGRSAACLAEGKGSQQATALTNLNALLEELQQQAAAATEASQLRLGGRLLVEEVPNHDSSSSCHWRR